MRSHLKASSFFQLNEKNINEMRKLGLLAHIAPKGGLSRYFCSNSTRQNSTVLNENISSY